MALVALLELVVEADAEVSDDEVATTESLISAIGEDAYNEAVAAVDERFGDDEDALRSFLESIARQEARELIYGAVLEAAMPDAIGGRESALLDWLAKAWSITVRFEDPEA